MRRLFSLVLAVTLAFAAVPAFAEPLPPQRDDPVVGVGDEARSIDSLLQAGDYAPGRVLARVTDEFAPIAPFSNDAAAWSMEPLFTYAPNASDSAARSLADNNSVADRVLLIESNTMTTEELLRQLAGAPGVVAAEPDYVRTIGDPEAKPSVGLEPEQDASAAAAAARVAVPAEAATNDPLLDKQWQLSSTAEAAGGSNARELWQELGIPQASAELKSVVVAVIDSGVDYTHPDLQGVMWSNPGNLGLPGAVGSVGYNFGEGTDDPMDFDEHGTHVAGIVAAANNNAEGGSGVAPNVRIMALRIADKAGQMYNSSGVGAYDYLKRAALAGVPVVAANNSWGGMGVSGLLNSVMDDAYRSANVVSVCASGNSSLDNDLSPINPSNGPSEGVIAVNAADRTGALAGFSCYGAATTDLAAPGNAILSTVPASWGMVDLENASFVALQDDFEQPAGLFAFATAGDAPASVARTDEDWAGSAASGHSLQWGVHAAKEGQEASLVSAPIDAAAAIEQAGMSVDDVRFLGFDVKLTDSAASGYGRVLHLFLSSTDPNNPWIELLSDEPGKNPATTYGSWSTVVAAIPDDRRGSVDWQNLSIKVTRNLVPFDNGLDLRFNIDNVSLVTSTIPYAYLSGTSMAAPVVTGALALLAGAFPHEDASVLRARVLGGVERTEALAGTCTSDGRLDLARAASDPYPVVDALEPAARADAGARSSAIVRGSWFGDVAGRVLLDGEELPVASWSAQGIVVELPQQLEAKMRYVQVVRADGESGRRLFLTGQEAPPACYESLPAPDLQGLGMADVDQGASWQVASAHATVYATSDKARVEQAGGAFYALLAYDPSSRAWSIEHALDGVFDSSFLMAAHDDVLYLFDLSRYLLYRYDTASRTLSDPLDCSSLAGCGDEETNLSFSGATCDGSSLWLCGGTLSDGTGSSLAVRVDVRTGEATALPLLANGRATPSVQMLDGTLTVAAGNSSVEFGEAVNSVEQLRADEWTRASLPDAVDPSQSGAVASAVLPGGVGVNGIATEGERLVLAGLIGAGDAGSAGAAEGAGSAGADTYVFDPATGSWQTVRERLSVGKVVYGGATVLDNALYVVGEDVLLGSTVFKRLVLDAAPAPQPPMPPAPSMPSASPTSDAGDSKPLVRTGDAVPFASIMVLGAVAIACGALATVHRRRR